MSKQTLSLAADTAHWAEYFARERALAEGRAATEVATERDERWISLGGGRRVPCLRMPSGRWSADFWKVYDAWKEHLRVVGH